MKNNLRYGIRKHKLGAHSVFLGTMIVVGIGQDERSCSIRTKDNSRRKWEFSYLIIK
ncbi:YSIRK-type signal peptide-containing protein [Staphylococcus aureus]